jgi:hypothetical protein
MLRLLALLLLLAPAAHAQTFKWVDERGVVNYSNTPPPSVGAAPQPIAERVSTYEPDPVWRRVAAYSTPTPYEAMQQQEWLQRQRLMAEAQNLEKALAAAPPVDDFVYSYPLYRSAYGYPYGQGRASVKRSSFKRGPQVEHHHHRGGRRF